jgi:hypothetical protein
MRKRRNLQTKRPSDEKTPTPPCPFEARKGILAYYSSGIWEGDLRAMRKDRVLTKRPDTNRQLTTGN